MKNYKFIFVWLIIIAILVAGFLFYKKNKAQEKLNTPQIDNDLRSMFPIKIDEKEIIVEIANTDKKREIGLSKYSVLTQNQGMLFLFDRIDYFSIWMKDMQFPIDIIWIDHDYKVADLTENVAPETYPKTFRPKVPVRFVLETNAGFISKNNIKIGDTASLGNIYVPPVRY